MRKTKFSRGVLVGMAVAMLAGGSVTAARADSIVGDFSPSSNPNGPWSYGSTPLSGSPFTAFPIAGSTVAGFFFPFLNTWTNSAGFPIIVYNNSGAPQTYITITQPSDELNLHPSSIGEHAVVRWTAPSTGVFMIQGQFEGIDQVVDTTTNVAIFFDSSTSLFSGNINTSNAPAPFSLTRAVNFGDTIDFSVGYGSNNEYSFDSTGLKGTITPLTSTVPEPSTLLLIGSGMIGLLRTRGRFRLLSPREH